SRPPNPAFPTGASAAGVGAGADFAFKRGVVEVLAGTSAGGRLAAPGPGPGTGSTAGTGASVGGNGANGAAGKGGVEGIVCASSACGAALAGDVRALGSASGRKRPATKIARPTAAAAPTTRSGISAGGRALGRRQGGARGAGVWGGGGGMAAGSRVEGAAGAGRGGA